MKNQSPSSDCAIMIRIPPWIEYARGCYGWRWEQTCTKQLLLLLKQTPHSLLHLDHLAVPQTCKTWHIIGHVRLRGWYLVRLSCASVLNSESQHVHACNHLWFSERNSWCNHEDELSRCVHWEVAMMKYMLPGEACFLSTKKCHLHQNKDNLVLLNVLTDYSPATKQSRHKNWQN